MKIKTLLITSLMASTLFFSLQAVGSGSQCAAARAEVDRVTKIRDSYPLHSPQWVQAAFAVLDAEYYVTLACVATTIGFE